MKEWDEGRVSGTFQRIDRHTFTGRLVPINSENEKAIIKARMIRLERAAAKARIKSLTWLSNALKRL